MTPGPDRDLRIDALRGLALLMIFVNHLAYLSGDLTLRNGSLGALTLCDFANVFVFVSGYVAGLVYGPKMDRDGFAATRRRIFSRARQLYRWHLGTLLFTLFLVAILQASGLDILDRARLMPFFSNPLGILPAVLSMGYTPYAFDVLRLYVILLAVLPFWLALRKRSLPLAVGVSVAVYLVPQVFPGFNLPDWPGDRVWYFNPLAWQIQFFLGTALAGWKLPGFWRSKRAAVLAGIILVGGVLVRQVAPGWLAAQAFHIPFIHDDLLFGKLPMTDKTSLGPVRLLSFGALAILTLRWLPGSWSGWRGPWLRPLALCGRQALKIYCLGLVMVHLLGHSLAAAEAGTPWVIAVTGVGVVLQIAAAYALETLQKQGPPIERPCGSMVESLPLR